MGKLPPYFQQRWLYDEATESLVPDETPLPSTDYWWVTGYAQVQGWTLVEWEQIDLNSGESIAGEALYHRRTIMGYTGGALDLYAPSEFETQVRNQVQNGDRAATNMVSTVWNRVNQTQGNYGCPCVIALRLRSPENWRPCRVVPHPYQLPDGHSYTERQET